MLADTLGPVLGGPEAGSVMPLYPNAKASYPGVSLPFWEIFPVSIRDLGSGVVPSSIDATLDSVSLIVEPDLLRHRILVELPDHVALGAHCLYIAASDEMGNNSSVDIILNCLEENQ